MLNNNDLEVKNLGVMNGWTEQPKEYLKCIREKHTLSRRKLWTCYYEYVCPKCGIKYEVDSS